MTASAGGRTATCRQANAPGGTALVALGIERGILSISRCLVDPPKREGEDSWKKEGTSEGERLSFPRQTPPPIISSIEGTQRREEDGNDVFPQWRMEHHKLNPLPKPLPGPFMNSHRRLLAFRFPKLVEGGEGGISREKGEEEETLRARMKKPLSRPLFHTLPHPHPPSSQPVRRERRRGG